MAASTLLTLPLDAIRPHPDNVREQLADLGLIQPLTVAPDRDAGYVLIAGHRRFAAARLAELETVPAVVRADLVGEKLVEAMLVENLHRVDLSPIEEARAMHRLVVEHGYTQDQIAARIGRSNAWVSQRLFLLTLPPELQRRLISKDITLTRAVELAQKLQGRQPGDVDRGWDKPHFTKKHPLANRARRLCDASEHGLRRRIGNIACGACWEQTIRADERVQPDKPASVDPPPKTRSEPAAPPKRRNKAKAPEPSQGHVRGIYGNDVDLAATESRRDDQGRVICRACGTYISSSLGCGCDPGELDDEGHPLDPRYQHLVVEVCAR